MDWFAMLVFTAACISSGLVIGYVAGRIDADRQRAIRLDGDK